MLRIIFCSRIRYKQTLFEMETVFLIELRIVKQNFFFKHSSYSFISNQLFHGGLSQWCRSNRPRIRPGTVKSLNAPWELSKLALARDYVKKIDPCRMLVWSERRTVPQDRVSTRCNLAGRYKLGRSCSNSNLLQGQSDLAYVKIFQIFLF